MGKKNPKSQKVCFFILSFKNRMFFVVAFIYLYIFLIYIYKFIYPFLSFWFSFVVQNSAVTQVAQHCGGLGGQVGFEGGATEGEKKCVYKSKLVKLKRVRRRWTVAEFLFLFLLDFLSKTCQSWKKNKNTAFPCTKKKNKPKNVLLALSLLL